MNNQSRMLQLVTRFLRNQSGVTAIEYAVLGGLLAIAIVVGATAVGTNLNIAFSAVNADFSAG